ncbi:MAG: CDP-glucose 4,6-dehydratase [Alphaproteobacteria bacterium]|nr:MAG: CDP-glucose 4,6-dehydratase [Alphaproteobacteria bacterium]
MIDRSFWVGRRVLLTGHTGFKGAWLALWLERLGAEVHGIALPPETPAGSAAGLWQAVLPRVASSHWIDIRDRSALAPVVSAIAPEVVFHLAAQALVRRSYREPVETFATNVQGTANLLDALRLVPSPRATVVVTSDKVYANDDRGRAFVEGDPLGGKDPYSASKAACELLVASWRTAVGDRQGMALATARAGNVIGGGDVSEDRLLPDLFRAVRAGTPLLLRNPEATRPWQHVLEPLAGYLLLAQQMVTGRSPPAVNFGPDREGVWSVRQVIELALAALGRGQWQQDGEPGPPEAKRLALDPSLAQTQLGWQPRLSVTEAVGWTVDWALAQGEGANLRTLSLTQIMRYEERMAS